MGISILLRTESLEVLARVDDERNILHRLLPEEGSGSLLAGIDWYGDAVFNRLQMDQFLSEWEALSRKTSDPEDVALIDGIKQLALRCQSEPHLYLSFIGD